MTGLLPLALRGAIVRRKAARLLGPVDVTVEGQGITVVIGPNGSGKTTLLRALHGIERLDAGSRATALPEAEARRRQAFVFQSPIMLRRSVAENLAYPLRLRRTGRAERRAAVADWAGRIGLGGALDLRATRLSGGERQKLAIGRALIAEPDLLFLDEPSANLDGRSTRAIEGLIADAVAAGVRVVLSTHDMGQARRLADEVIFLTGGRIREQGRSILGTPGTADLAAFIRGDIVE